LGPAGQYGVAVEFLLDLQRGVEVEGHLQLSGDLMGLVDPAGARAADVELLQAHHVRLELGDHGRDAIDIEPAVDADAAMDVVGQDPWHGAPASLTPKAEIRSIIPTPQAQISISLSG